MALSVALSIASVRGPVPGMSRSAGDPDCEQRAQAAAYVLGALEPDENHRYTQHLRRCATCREDVANLQVAVDALAAATPRLEPEQLRERIMRPARAEAELFRAAAPDEDRRVQRRWRPRRVALRAAAGAIACVIAVGAFLIGEHSSTPRQRLIPATVTASAPDAHAELLQTGTRAELIVSGMPPPPAGKTYEVWLARPGHAPEPTDALFSVDQTGGASVDVPGNLHGIRRVMVTAEPLGGSLRPTSTPILIATL